MVAEQTTGKLQGHKAKKNETSFKPGQSGNPFGRAPTPADIKELRIQKTLQIIGLIGKFADMGTKELSDHLHSGKTTALESLIGTMYTKGINGSLPHAEALLERIAGAVPKPIVTLDSEGNHQPIQMHLSPDKLLAIMVKLQELPEDQPCKLIPNLLECSPASSPPSSPPPSGTES